VVVNPYSQPLPFNQNERNARFQAPCLSATKAPASRSSAKPTTSSSSLSTIEEDETSPTIRRILAATGCSNRQELLAKRAAQEANTNRSKSAPNGLKAATNGSKSTNQSKSMNKSTSINGSKARNGSKAAKNGSKSRTNPKKITKSKYSLDTLHSSDSKWCHSLNIFLHLQLRMHPMLHLGMDPMLCPQSRWRIRREPSLRTDPMVSLIIHYIRMYSHVTLPIKKHCIVLCIHSHFQSHFNSNSSTTI